MNSGSLGIQPVYFTHWTGSSVSRGRFSQFIVSIHNVCTRLTHETITLEALSLVEKAENGPSSLLRTTLEGPTEYTSECKMDVKCTWIPTWHPMDHGSWSPGLFSKTTSWRYAYHKTRRPWHSKRSQPWVYPLVSYVRNCMSRNLLK